MLPSLLLSSIVSIALSTSGRTAQDCTIGDQWTENFIRFECYQGTGLVVKGVRAIGCVPTNTDAGAMIQSGATFDEQYFTYRCTKSKDVVAYQIINCRDSSGKVLSVGQSRDMGDGSVWKCYKDAQGAIKLSQDKPGGCLYDGKTYTAGKAWIQNQEFKATVGGIEQIIGTGILVECKSLGAQGYVGKATGCVTTSGKTMYNGDFLTVSSLNVKCMVGSTGTVTMSVVNDDDVTCSFEGVTVKNGETYTTADGVNVYRCVYGVMRKSGCMVNGVRYSANKFMYVDGKPFFCNGGAGSINFGNITGCTLPDGSVKNFWYSWVNGTESHRCRYYTSKGNVITYIEIRGCWYNSRVIDRNAIVGSDDDLKKCGIVESKWTMRNLTTAEYTAYNQLKSVKGSQNVIGGGGGSGVGGDLMGEPMTTIDDDDDDTTTTKPTKPTKPSVQTTRAIVMTTTPPPLADPGIRSTTPKIVIPEIIPKTTSIVIPSADKPTTTAQEQCQDQFEMCSSLAPICHSHQNSISNLRQIIKTTNVTVDQIKEILDLMGIAKPLTSSEEEKEEMDEVIRGLTGFDSEEQQDCGCTDDPCVNRCQKRKRPSCKKCQIFKRKVRELVLMVCPATCGSCDRVGKVPAIIKALVRFYTHDCR